MIGIVKITKVGWPPSLESIARRNHSVAKVEAMASA
jgi:hypothetical protein